MVQLQERTAPKIVVNEQKQNHYHYRLKKMLYSKRQTLIYGMGNTMR